MYKYHGHTHYCQQIYRPLCYYQAAMLVYCLRLFCSCHGDGSDGRRVFKYHGHMHYCTPEAVQTIYPVTAAGSINT